jgi:hypothetical protein
MLKYIFENKRFVCAGPGRGHLHDWTRNAIFQWKNCYVMRIGRAEVLHDHVTAAMLDGRNSEIFLHENQFNSSGERYSIVLPSNMAAIT